MNVWHLLLQPARSCTLDQKGNSIFRLGAMNVCLREYLERHFQGSSGCVRQLLQEAKISFDGPNRKPLDINNLSFAFCCRPITWLERGEFGWELLVLDKTIDPVDVTIHQSDGSARPVEADRQIQRNRALANAAFARTDGNHVLHLLKHGWRGELGRLF